VTVQESDEVAVVASQYGPPPTAAAPVSITLSTNEYGEGEAIQVYSREGDTVVRVRHSRPVMLVGISDDVEVWIVGTCSEAGGGKGTRSASEPQLSFAKPFSAVWGAAGHRGASYLI